MTPPRFSQTSCEIFQHAGDMLYSYAAFLKSQNRLEESREWTQRLFDKKRTLPRYMQRIERPWFAKGKALLAELNTSAPKETAAAN